MRLRHFGWAIAAIAMLGPMQAWGGDREIAEQIMKRLKGHRDSGALKDFTLDMKVDSGVVSFRGSVREPEQRLIVLESAAGIDGIAKVLDEVTVTGIAADNSSIVKPKASVARLERPQTDAAEDFSLRQALTSKVESVRSTYTGDVAQAAGPASGESFRVVTASNGLAGQVMPAAAMELASPHTNNDQSVTQSVVAALGRAQQSGQLRGFGVDVKSSDGIVELTGRAASESQRDSILRIASNVPGVVGVRESINVTNDAPTLTRLPEPTLAPEAGNVPAMNTPYRMQPGQPIPAQNASMGGVPMMGAPVSGGPVPMAPYGGGAAAPRYDSPYLPNYAWPGYAAYPNYAAVTYPQQYSPSAWPYIGPFYPYPQVPLGWRRVSLEWDDGWWNLDFTDR